MSKHDPVASLRQMADLGIEAQTLVAGYTLDSLVTDRVRTLALERLMECIGEAVKRLPAELRDRYPAADWKRAAGMRDWLVHGYDGVDHSILWKAVHERLPELLETVAQMLADLGGEPPADGATDEEE